MNEKKLYFIQMINGFILFLLINRLVAYYISPNNHKITSINSFAFGSCYNLHKNVSKYEIFNIIHKNKPDFFMWLGDAAYVRFARQSKYKLVRKYQYYFSVFDEFNRTRVLRQFNNTKYSADYRPFDLKYPIIGIWDDNDYGQNDGNKHFKYKEEMKEIFLDFLDEPKNSTRRNIGKGIYTTYTFGDMDSYKNIRVILLDVRYNKSSLIESDRDMLGEDQWKWFEDVLVNANETFIFISSGTQILPVDRLLSECWFPESRLRLFNLLKKIKKNGIVLLTGDIHNGQLLKTPCAIEGIGYQLIEITSSGLGHYCKPNCDLAIDFVLPNYYKVSAFIIFIFSLPQLLMIITMLILILCGEIRKKMHKWL